MTIQAWTLLFSAITSGLVLVGGIWLRYVVNQQLKTKDTTIETLNAAIKLQEGEIAALKGDRAPAIAVEYKTMRDYAQQITEEKSKLDEQVKCLTEQQQQEKGNTSLAKASGLLLAADILVKNVRKPSKDGLIPYEVFVQGALNALREIATEGQRATTEAIPIRKVRTPSLDYSRSL